jgi:hypothetical protein
MEYIAKNNTISMNAITKAYKKKSKMPTMFSFTLFFSCSSSPKEGIGIS